MTMLGLVPSIAKAWRASDCMRVRVLSRDTSCPTRHVLHCAWNPQSDRAIAEMQCCSALGTTGFPGSQECTHGKYIPTMLPLKQYAWTHVAFGRVLCLNESLESPGSCTHTRRACAGRRWAASAARARRPLVGMLCVLRVPGPWVLHPKTLNPYARRACAGARCAASAARERRPRPTNTTGSWRGGAATRPWSRSAAAPRSAAASWRVPYCSRRRRPPSARPRWVRTRPSTPLHHPLSVQGLHACGRLATLLWVHGMHFTC